MVPCPEAQAYCNRQCLREVVVVVVVALHPAKEEEEIVIPERRVESGHLLDDHFPLHSGPLTHLWRRDAVILLYKQLQ